MASEAEFPAFVAGLRLARRAAALAGDAHRGQERAVDGAPYALHAFEVALLLHQVGCRDEVVAAGLLHDTIEKGTASVDALREALGEPVAAMVAALTEDERVADYRERKAQLRAAVARSCDDVVAVFGADKVVNARDLRVVAAADRLPAREVACKHEHYRASLALLERRLPGHPFTDALRFELDAQLRIPALAWLRSAAERAPALT